MTRVLRRPRWIVLSMLVLAAVAVMVELGLWQLRRLHTIREDNALVRSRMAAAPVPLTTLLPPGADADRIAYRRVRVTGRYDRVSEILVRNRSFQGQPGSHILTPLRMADGRALLVDRGWIPQELSGSAEEKTRPPVFVDVEVVGVLFPSERKGLFAPSIPPAGRLTTTPRIDMPRIAKQLEYPTLPLYLRLQSQAPPQSGDLPVPPGLPDLSEGPHLSYAIQWFIFATIAALTYLAVVRRQMRREAP